MSETRTQLKGKLIPHLYSQHGQKYNFYWYQYCLYNLLHWPRVAKKKNQWMQIQWNYYKPADTQWTLCPVGNPVVSDYHQKSIKGQLWEAATTYTIWILCFSKDLCLVFFWKMFLELSHHGLQYLNFLQLWMASAFPLRTLRCGGKKNLRCHYTLKFCHFSSLHAVSMW